MPFSQTRAPQTETTVLTRMTDLVNNFGHYHAIFIQRNPFSQPNQLNYHVTTLARLRQLGTAEGAAADPTFVQGVWQTLDAWGMNSRRARLISLQNLQQNFVAVTPQIAQVHALTLDALGNQAIPIARHIWGMIQTLAPSATRSQLVGGTKALHHLLPALIPPIDRQYTRRFFQFHVTQFQVYSNDPLLYIFERMVDIASKLPKGIVSGNGWASSLPKMIDNAIVGYVIANQATQNFPK